MNATRKLRDIHQSIWLDTITRGLLTSGTLEPARKRSSRQRHLRFSPAQVSAAACERIVRLGPAK